MRVLVGSGVSLILLWILLAAWSNQSSLFPVAGLLGILALAWVIVLFALGMGIPYFRMRVKKASVRDQT